MGSRAVIAKNIKHFRLQKRLSQEQLALQAGIDRTYVSGLERGVRNPSVDLLDKIAKVLSIKTVQLFGTTEGQSPKPLPRGRSSSSKPG